MGRLRSLKDDCVFYQNCHRLKIILICCFLLLPFLAAASSLQLSSKDTLSWVDQFMTDVIKAQKQRRSLPFNTSSYVKNRLILDKGPDRILGKSIQYYSNINNNQLVWLDESYSQLHYSPKSGYREQVNAAKTYGKYPSWEFKSAAQLSVNFSENLVKFESLSDKSFVSPLSQNAFDFYHYQLVAQENDQITIRVTPKHRFSPTFVGEMTFSINSCKLTHLDLKISGDKGINFIDTLHVVQSYGKDDITPLYTLLTYEGAVLKFFFTGSSHAVFTKSEADTSFYKNFHKNEVVRDDSSTYRSRILEENRKVPLTLQERLSYHYEDSLNRMKKGKPIIDSLENLEPSVKLLPLLFSDKVWISKNRRRALVFDPIVPAFFFNTVEGFGIDYGVSVLKFTESNKAFSLTPRIRYGFENGELNSDVSASWFYRPKKRGTLNFSIGSTYLDLNPNGSLNTLQNTLNTLFFEQNFMKLYRKEYVSMGIGRELVGNLYLSVGTELANNYSVTNTKDFVFRNIKERNFSSNNPISPELEERLFPVYTSFLINSSLIYTLKQPYIMKDKIKIYNLPLGPRFILTYKKGLPNLFGSSSNYNFLEAEIQQEKLDFGLLGYGSYSVSAGKFLTAKSVYYPEWRHFRGNLALIFNPGLRSFHLLNFYTYSTNEYFWEGHLEHNFNQLFTNKIPGLRKLKIQEMIGGAYLFQPEKGHYFETYAGFKRLIFRVDYAVSFNGGGVINQGFKISYNF